MQRRHLCHRNLSQCVCVCVFVGVFVCGGNVASWLVAFFVLSRRWLMSHGCTVALTLMCVAVGHKRKLLTAVFPMIVIQMQLTWLLCGYVAGWQAGRLLWRSTSCWLESETCAGRGWLHMWVVHISGHKYVLVIYIYIYIHMSYKYDKL